MPYLPLILATIFFMFFKKIAVCLSQQKPMIFGVSPNGISFNCRLHKEQKSDYKIMYVANDDELLEGGWKH